MIARQSRTIASFAEATEAGLATRDAYGEALLALGEEDDRIVVLDGDLSRSTRTEWWEKKFPDRFINAGIAEQNLIGMAAGLASVGFVPFATTYVIFVTRALDQIRQSVCFAGANVKIVGSHSGYAASFDGGSHQGLEDIAMLGVLPGMTVLAPLDHPDTVRAVRWAARHEGPVYIRTQKEASGVVTDGGEAEDPFAIRQWGEGTDLALVATGSRVHAALLAAAELARDGHDVRVLGVAALKPFDETGLREAIGGARQVVTVEEHMVRGGLFDLACVALRGTAVPVHPIAAIDRFGETGSWHELLRANGLDTPGIRDRARAILRCG